MKTGSMRVGVLLAAMLTAAGATAWGATSTSTWDTAISGDWTNATSWTGSAIPGAGSEARLTPGGGTYTATWSGGGAAFENLVITNAGANTTTLNIEAAGFRNTNGKVTLGQGARVYVKSGGVWDWTGNNTAYTPLLNMVGGAELHIDGGTMSFTNIVGSARANRQIDIGSVANSTGTLYVTDGTLQFTQTSGDYPFLRIGAGIGATYSKGLIFQTGGRVNIKGGSINLGDQQAVGQYDISGGVFEYNGYLLVDGIDGLLKVSGSGIVSNSAAWSSPTIFGGTRPGSYGKLKISGGRYTAQDSYTGGTLVFGGTAGATGVLEVTSGTLNALTSLLLGKTGGTGLGTISGGDVVVDGTARPFNNGPSGLVLGDAYSTANTTGRGALTMSDGTLNLKGYEGGTYGARGGLVVAYSTKANATGVMQGEFNLTGGNVTNADYLVVGYNQGSTGVMTQTGGRYVQKGTAARPMAVGYGGGIGTLVISNGTFEALNGSSLYVGGASTNAGPTPYSDPWAGGGLSTGRLVVAGGTLTLGNSLIVATNGTGTAVFSGGTTTALNLHLVGANATLRFDLGPTGAGSLSVTNMTIGAGAKLEVDASQYNWANRARVKLVSCASRTGSFAEGDITTTAGLVDQSSGPDIWLALGGTVITIR